MTTKINIQTTAARLAKQIKKSARSGEQSIVGYNELLEWGPIDIWVDGHYNGPDLTEEEHWAVVEIIENRLKKWKRSTIINLRSSLKPSKNY